MWESQSPVGIVSRLPAGFGRCYPAGMVRYRIDKARPLQVREAAAEYHVDNEIEPIQCPGVYHVTISDRGRLVLPADVRERLNIHDGDRVAVGIEDDGTIYLRTRDVAIKRLRGAFKHLNKPGVLASDELIAGRRREARMDDERNRKWAASQRRTKKQP